MLKACLQKLFSKFVNKSDVINLGVSFSERISYSLPTTSNPADWITNTYVAPFDGLLLLTTDLISDEICIRSTDFSPSLTFSRIFTNRQWGATQIEVEKGVRYIVEVKNPLANQTINTIFVPKRKLT